MKSLITQKLKQVIKETGAKLILVSDIAAAFLDDDISEEKPKNI